MYMEHGAEEYLGSNPLNTVICDQNQENKVKQLPQISFVLLSLLSISMLVCSDMLGYALGRIDCSCLHGMFYLLGILAHTRL
jgi:hypothetical protein